MDKIKIVEYGSGNSKGYQLFEYDSTKPLKWIKRKISGKSCFIAITNKGYYITKEGFYLMHFYDPYDDELECVFSKELIGQKKIFEKKYIRKIHRFFNLYLKNNR